MILLIICGNNGANTKINLLCLEAHTEKNGSKFQVCRNCAYAFHVQEFHYDKL